MMMMTNTRMMMATSKKGKKLVVELKASKFYFRVNEFPDCCAANIVSGLDYDDGLLEERYDPDTMLWARVNKDISDETYSNRTFSITDTEIHKLKRRVLSSCDTKGMIFAITAHYQREWEAVMEWLGFTQVHTYKRDHAPDGSILTTWMIKPKGYKF